jgi:uncharacterized membrane protein
MKRFSDVELALLIFYALFWMCGIGAYALYGGPPRNVAWTAPLFLFLAAGIVIFVADGRDRTKLLLCAVLGFVAEVVGVHTGYPFGRYAYTDTLAPGFYGVPLAMGAAWVALLAYVMNCVFDISPLYWKRCVLGGVLMTAIDFLIDPLAAGPLHYWQWEHDGIYYGVPLVNFAGWLIVSTLILLAVGPLRKRNRTYTIVGVSLIAFFTVLALIFKMVAPFGIGLALCALEVGRQWVSRRRARNFIT